MLSLFFTFTNPTGEYFNTWNSGEILGVLLRGGGNGSDNLWNFSAPPPDVVDQNNAEMLF